MGTKSAVPVDEERKQLVARLLREARLHEGLTQQQVADVVGVSSDTVGRWEQGRQVPSLYYWKRLCTLLQTTPANLGLVDALPSLLLPATAGGLPPRPDARDTALSGSVESKSRKPRVRQRLRVVWLLLLVTALLVVPAATTLPSRKPVLAALAGAVAFKSSGQGNAAANQGAMDELHFSLSGLAVPARDAGYYAWMAKPGGSTETRWQPLGWLIVLRGTATLTYRDPQRRNLLALYNRFLITHEQTTFPPLQPSATWVAMASISVTPFPGDPHHYSLLDHLQHLLAADPALERLRIQGGLSISLAEATSAVQQEAASLVALWHAHREASLHAGLIRILDELDGSGEVSQDVPSGTPFLAGLPAARVGLLTLSPTENPPGYVLHTDLHLEGVAGAPGASPMQQQEANRLRVEMNAIALALTTVREDALSFVRASCAELAHASTLSRLIALEREAFAAWQGFGESPGVAQIAVEISRLATVPFQPA